MYRLRIHHTTCQSNGLHAATILPETCRSRILPILTPRLFNDPTHSFPFRLFPSNFP